MQTEMRKEWVLFLLAACFPLIFTASWLSANTLLPTSDASDYFLTGYKIYHHFTDHGILAGLLHFDIARGFRPIFFSVFTVPFLFISQGKVDFAYHAVALSCVLASAIYVYLLSRCLLNRFSSMLAANIIVLLPFVQVPVLTFFAESALFPAVLATLYHLVRSDYFRDQKHAFAFALWLALAVVIRPVEAVTECAFFIALFLVSGWQQKIFSFRQLAWVVALATLTNLLFVFYVGLHFIHHYPFHPIDGGLYDIRLAKSIYLVEAVSLAMTFAAFLTVLFSPPSRETERQTRPSLVLPFSLCFMLVLLWFLPHAFQTYLWVFRTSIGDLADITGRELGSQSLSQAFRYFGSEASLVLIAGLSGLAVLSVLLLQKKQWKPVMLSQPVIYLLLLIPFPLWEVLFTSQTAIRKLNLAFPALMLVLLLIGLQRGKAWGLKFMLAGFLLVLQFGFAMGFLHVNGFGTYPAPVSVAPNPYDVVIAFLNTQAKDYHLKNIAIMNDVEKALPVDPHALSMLYQIKQLPYKMGIPAYPDYSDNLLHVFRQAHDAVFLSDKAEDMVVSPAAAAGYQKKFDAETNPTLKLLYQLLYAYASNHLQASGWLPGPCLKVQGIDHHEYQGCILTGLRKQG